MLSANKILIFLLIGIYSSSLFAVDVSNFDIKGIKLGMSKSEVLKHIPCNQPKIDVYKLENGKIFETTIYCIKNNKNDLLTIKFNHNGIVQRIRKDIHFDIKPIFSKIKHKFIIRYGVPDLEGKQTHDGSTGALRTMCWGSCSFKKKDPIYRGKAINYWPKNSSNLYIEYNNFNEQKDLSIILTDSRISSANYEWKEKENKTYKEEQKQKASNIDF